MAYFFKVLESVWICHLCCWRFQAVPAADPAHFLWRGCHGSALCHCRLNMEETPPLALPNTKTQHWREILFSTYTSCLESFIHGNFILIQRLRHRHVTLKRTSERITALYGWMDDWKKDLQTGHLRVADLKIKGIQRVCMDSCYQIVLNCWSDNHVVLHIHFRR